jgi:predicted dehydrogenase
MADILRVGIIGAGWPGQAHAKGYAGAGGYKLVALADLIPARREKLAAEHGIARTVADAADLISEPGIDVVSVCLPNNLHASTVVAALKAGKHVLCETPPALSAAQAKQIQKAAEKAGKIVLYAFQRRFGGSEMAARQAIAKGYAGDVYHARASWMRTRGVPAGTGWYTDRAQSGGGAMIDLGLHVLDLAWHMLGEPKPASAFASTHALLTPADKPEAVEDAAFALIRLEGGKTIELAASWAINQAPHHQGAICRVHGDKGAVEVYTPQGAMLYRGFSPKGESKATPLRGPKVTHHAALARHFRECILGKSQPAIGPAQGVLLMQMVEAIYKSAETGRGVGIK